MIGVAGWAARNDRTNFSPDSPIERCTMIATFDEHVSVGLADPERTSELDHVVVALAGRTGVLAHLHGLRLEPGLSQLTHDKDLDLVRQ